MGRRKLTDLWCWECWQWYDDVRYYKHKCIHSLKDSGVVRFPSFGEAVPMVDFLAAIRLVKLPSRFEISKFLGFYRAKTIRNISIARRKGLLHVEEVLVPARNNGRRGSGDYYLRLYTLTKKGRQIAAKSRYDFDIFSTYLPTCEKCGGEISKDVLETNPVTMTSRGNYVHFSCLRTTPRQLPSISRRSRDK